MIPIMPSIAALSATVHEPVLIIDAACQHSVARAQWLRRHEQHIRANAGLEVARAREDQSQTFSFGDGVPTQGNKCAVLPCATAGASYALRV